MNLLRQHPVFSVLFLFGVLGGLAQFVWAWSLSRERAAVVRQTEREARSLEALGRSFPPPTLENVRAVRAETERLRSLQELAANSLAATGAVWVPPPETSDDALFFEVVSFVETQRALANREGVLIEEALGFGFRALVDAGRIEPAEPASLRAFQRQLSQLDYLCGALLVSGADRLVSVERTPVGGGETRGAEIFEIDPLVSAARDGAIRTEAFRFVFEGRTAALRAFMGELARFERPIVVRDVFVRAVPPAPAPTRRQGERTRTPATPRPGAPTAADIFGAARTDPGSTEPSRPEEVPVIERNRSVFSVTVEFFELLAGDAKGDDA